MSEGKPLDETTRSQMESLLGHDLKEVRVHDSRQADRLAGRLGGEAFTVGSHVFGPSEKLSAGTTQGAGLLAHEITHVIQQTKPQELAFGTSIERPVAPPPAGQGRRRAEAQWPPGHVQASGPSQKGAVDLSGAPGRPSGAVQRQEDEIVAQRAEQEVIQAIGGTGGIEESEKEPEKADPEAIADMVYKMMLQDLVLERERGW